MEESKEPEYLIVLEKVYRKGSSVAYPNLANSFEEFREREAAETEGDYRQRQRIRNVIPNNKSLLPISSMEEYEISQAIRTLHNVGLIEETNQIESIPYSVVENHPDAIKYIRLTRKGFEVAHDRQIRQRQQRTSERVADLTEQQNKLSQLVTILTVILALAAISQVLIDVFLIL